MNSSAAFARQNGTRSREPRHPPVVAALTAWSGAAVLFGPSGRGKTSYLRHVLGTNAAQRFPFIYLRAEESGSDVIAAICARLEGLGRDRDLVTSLVHAGLFDIYIDGLNEVDREAQEVIVRFIIDHRSANIFVASQEISVSLPSKLSTYYLLPLTHRQMTEFLKSREHTLGADAYLRGDAFKEKAAAFIQELSEEIARPMAQKTRMHPADDPLRQAFLLHWRIRSISRLQQSCSPSILNPIRFASRNSSSV